MIRYSVLKKKYADTLDMYASNSLQRKKNMPRDEVFYESRVMEMKYTQWKEFKLKQVKESN